MNPDATRAEAASVAARLQPEAAAVVEKLAVNPRTPEYQAAVDWNNARLDLPLPRRRPVHPHDRLPAHRTARTGVLEEDPQGKESPPSQQGTRLRDHRVRRA